MIGNHAITASIMIVKHCIACVLDATQNMEHIAGIGKRYGAGVVVRYLILVMTKTANHTGTATVAILSFMMMRRVHE